MTRFINSFMDITKGKQMQECLLQNQTPLQLALKAANMGVWDWDLDANQLTWSLEVESLFGMAPGSFNGTIEAYFQCIPASDCYRVTQEIVNLMQGGNDYCIEHCISRGDGTLGWVSSRGVVLRNETGKAIRMTGIVMDITDRKQAELTLQQQAKQEQLVGAIAQRIRQSLELEEVLTTAVTEVRQLLQTDRVLLYRFQPDWSGVVVVESVHEGVTPILSTNVADPCFTQTYIFPYQEGRVRAIEDIHNADLDPCYIDFLKQLQVRANLVVPILQGNHLWGLLIAHHCSESRQWQESEVKLLKQLSVQLAIAIQQSGLVEQFRTELKERSLVERHLRQSEACLRQKASELEQAIQELRQTQAQLVQSEKMSGLGQMVAGVAHEINNPVSFIYGNLQYANRYAQDLLNLMQLYQQHYPEPAPEISTIAAEMELDFLVQDFPKLIASMKMGAERIRDLVVSLRCFSRLDQAEKKLADIHEGIDDTLLILQHRLRARKENCGIQIIKEYGDLPLVECYPGELNQVFMNIISNAIDVLETLKVENCNQPATPTIWIRTELQAQNRVVIRIKDNGPGMIEAVKRRIFDPFFTTKPVGQGTGLGLSISYQVVKSHHGGQLECLSTPGKGTEFVVELPLKQLSQESSVAA